MDTFKFKRVEEGADSNAKTRRYIVMNDIENTYILLIYLFSTEIKANIAVPQGFDKNEWLATNSMKCILYISCFFL